MAMSRMNFNTTHGNNGTLYELMLDRKRANMSNTSRVSRRARFQFNHKPYTCDYYRGEVIHDQED